MSLLWTSTASSAPYMRIPSGTSACAGGRSLCFGNRVHANPGGAEGGDDEESLEGVDTAATAWRDGSYRTSASFCTRAGQNMCLIFPRIRCKRNCQGHCRSLESRSGCSCVWFHCLPRSLLSGLLIIGPGSKYASFVTSGSL